MSRATDGAAPPVDTAICRQPRRRTLGVMTLHLSGTSTTFTNWLLAIASA